MSRNDKIDQNVVGQRLFWSRSNNMRRSLDLDQDEDFEGVQNHSRTRRCETK